MTSEELDKMYEQLVYLKRLVDIGMQLYLAYRFLSARNVALDEFNRKWVFDDEQV